jgi:hypothetical protein
MSCTPSPEAEVLRFTALEENTSPNSAWEFLNPVVSAFAMLFEVMSRAELAPVKPDNAILNVAMTQAPLDIMAPAVLAEAAVK